MNRSKLATWLYGLLWLALLALAIVAAALSQRKPAPPAGWQVWPDAGSILALATHQGRVYAGGYAGLVVYSADGVTAEVIPPNGRPWEVHCLLPAPDGSLLVGHDTGLAVIRAESGIYCVPLPGSQPAEVTSLACDAHNTLWLGSDTGICYAQLAELAQPGAVQAWPAASELAAGRITACLLACDGALWAGTYCAPEGGVSRWDGVNWQHWTPAEGLPHANITALLQASDGSVWAGCGFKSRGGAARFANAGGSWTLAETLGETELAGPKVRSLFEDGQGRLWLGSEQDGLTIRKGNATLAVVTPADGLPCAEVMSFTQSAGGDIWVGTLFGLARIEPKAVERLLGGV